MKFSKKSKTPEGFKILIHHEVQIFLLPHCGRFPAEALVDLKPQPFKYGCKQFKTLRNT